MHGQHEFKFVGIMESNQQSIKVDGYRRRIGLAQAVVNISNKIWAFVDEIYEVTVVIDIVQQLTLKLFNTKYGNEFMLTLVYAKCNATKRIELCDSLY